MDNARFHSERSSASTRMELDETDMMENEPQKDGWAVDRDEPRTNLAMEPVETSESHDRHPSISRAGDTGFDTKDEDLGDIELNETGEKQYEVQWDGDLDPDNPKSMHKARKWLIVLIVSSCSLCV